MLRAALLIALSFTLGCDPASQPTPQREPTSAPSDERAPTAKPTAEAPQPTPPIRETASRVTSDGLEVRARLFVKKLTAGDEVRLALSVGPAPGHEPEKGVSLTHDWARTLGSLRLVVSQDGATVATLALEGEPTATAGHIGEGTSDVRAFVIDGKGMAEGPVLRPWKQPKADLFAKPGSYTLALSGSVQLASKATAFRLEPLELEVVAAQADFKPMASLWPLAEAAAAKGRAGKPTAAGAPIDDTADNRWFRFTLPGTKMYDIAVVDVLLSPDGKLVATRAFDHFTCVAAGTPIATPSGPVPIERLAAGDVVWGYDTERGARIETTVVAITASESDALFDIAGLRVTGDHPIYADGAFRPARELAPGARLVSEDGAPIALGALGAVRASASRVRVFDLSVGWPHDYFAAGILVHNKAVHVPLGGGAPGDPWAGLFARPGGKRP